MEGLGSPETMPNLDIEFRGLNHTTTISPFNLKVITPNGIIISTVLNSILLNYLNCN